MCLCVSRALAIHLGLQCNDVNGGCALIQSPWVTRIVQVFRSELGFGFVSVWLGKFSDIELPSLYSLAPIDR